MFVALTVEDSNGTGERTKTGMESIIGSVQDSVPPFVRPAVITRFFLSLSMQPTEIPSASFSVLWTGWRLALTTLNTSLFSTLFSSIYCDDDVVARQVKNKKLGPKCTKG